MGANSAALAVVEVDFRHVVSVKFNAGFRAIYPADLTTRAFFSVYVGSKRSPRACLSSAGDAWT